MQTGTLVRKMEKLPENLKLKVEVFVDALISDTKSIEKQLPNLFRFFSHHPPKTLS
jgi:hypothetical protein